MWRERRTDVLIIGGGLGGVAAALSVLRLGRSVILTEETDWIGGQLTAQAVPPDEHPWIEGTGCTALYQRFRLGVRDYYRRNYPLLPEARFNPLLNPGEGRVSPLCHEPRVALAVLYEMLAPHLVSGRLEILFGCKASGVEAVMTPGTELCRRERRSAMARSPTHRRATFTSRATNLRAPSPVEYRIDLAATCARRFAYGFTVR